MTVSDETNQATIHADTMTGYAHAILRGFYHRIDAPVLLDLPPVAATTTYTIALQYDPTRAQAPVKLGVFTSVDQSGGKAYIVLHTVTRQPSQLLTQAE
ncbi:hypothetical protein ODZ83_11190, partial [Acaricomes phytoseiuli]|uniref:hypothetical protein n=1 Tax=Acaricomes phytoseiuli TaxID=291968 RepID=UPI00222162AE